LGTPALLVTVASESKSLPPDPVDLRGSGTDLDIVAGERAVIVISRFHVEETGAEEFLDRARRALDAFADRPGYVRGRIGRAADDPALWTIVTEWASVGAFRRSLSAFDVKMYAAPLLGESIEEPAAYEVIVGVDGSVSEVAPSDRAADAGTTRVGEGAIAHAPRSVDPL
jgi:quinol monooxygenase YgiN